MDRLRRKGQEPHFYLLRCFLLSVLEWHFMPPHTQTNKQAPVSWLMLHNGTDIMDTHPSSPRFLPQTKRPWKSWPLHQVWHHREQAAGFTLVEEEGMPTLHLLPISHAPMPVDTPRTLSPPWPSSTVRLYTEPELLPMVIK